MAEVRGVVTMIWTKTTGEVININQSLDTASCWIRSKWMDLEREDLTKFLQKLYLKIEGGELSNNLTVTIFHTDDLNAPEQFVGPFNLNQVSALAVRPPGAKFYSIRLDDTGIQTRWRFSQMELFGQIGGMRF